MQTFDDIYVLDLHGNAKKKERARRLRDENVFDIQQGVAIGIFVKEPGKAGPAPEFIMPSCGVSGRTSTPGCWTRLTCSSNGATAPERLDATSSFPHN